MAVEGGQVYVSVISEAKGLASSMTKQTTEAATAAGKAASKELTAQLSKSKTVKINASVDEASVDASLKRLRNSKGQFIKLGAVADEASAKAAGKKMGIAAKAGATTSSKGNFFSSMFSGNSSAKLGASEGKKLGGSYRSALAEQIKGIAGLFAGVYVAEKIKDIAKESVEAAEAQEKVTGLTEAVLKSTGDAANVTAENVKTLGNSLSKTTGVTSTAIQANENLLLTFTNIKNNKYDKVFDDATIGIQDMTAATHKSSQTITLALGKALNDPIKNLSALGRMGVQFSAPDTKQIQGWVKAGDLVHAQTAILDEVETKFGGAAKAVATPAEKMRAAWQLLQVQMGNKLLPVLAKVANWASSKALPAISGFFGDIGKHDSEIKSVAGAVADLVKKIGSAAFGTAKALFAALVPLFKEMGDSLNKDVVPLFQKLADTVNKDVIPGIRSLSKWIADNHTTVQSITVGILAMVVAYKALIVVGKAFAVIQGIINAVMAANLFVIIALAIIGLAAAFIYAYKHSQTFRDIVKQVLNDVKAIALDVAHFFSKDFVGFFVGAFDTVKGGLETFGGYFVTAFDMVESALKIFGGYFVTGFDVVETFFTKTLPGWFEIPIDYIKNHWRGLGQLILIASGIGTVPALIWKYWSPITGFFKAIGSGIMSGLGAVGNFFTKTLPGWFQAPLNYLEAHWRGISQIISGPLFFVTGLVEKYWNQIIGFFTSAPGKILAAFTGAGRWLLNIGSDILNGLWNGIQSVWNSRIVQWFVGMGARFVGFLLKARVWLHDKGADVINGAWDGISSAWSGVSRWFGGIGVRVASYFMKAVSWLYNAGRSILSGLWSGIVSVWNSAVVQWLLSMGPRIAGYFGKAGSWLLGSGNSVIGGLWHGVTSAFGTVSHWFTGMASRIGGYFKGAGKWLLKTGEDIIGGLGSGITNGAKKALGWLEKPVNAIMGVIHRFINLVNKGLGTVGVKIPNIPTSINAKGGVLAFADGGVTPGYTPGKDVHKFISPTGGVLMLSGGEAVMRPEWTKAVGGPQAVKKMNDAARKGGLGAAAAAALPTLADLGKRKRQFFLGGVIGDLGKAGSYVGSKIKAGAQITAHEAKALVVSAINHVVGAAATVAHKGINSAVPASMVRDMGNGVVNNIANAIKIGGGNDASKLKGQSKTGAASAVGQAFVGNGNVMSWIKQALSIMGMAPSASLINGISSLIMNESGGNPNAINNYDSNAIAGHPSQGLMQTIPSTFAAYVWPALKNAGIMNPVANITAGVRYAIANYGIGMLAAGGNHGANGGYKPYAQGGDFQAGQSFIAGEHGREILNFKTPGHVTSAANSAAVLNGGGASAKEIGDAVASALSGGILRIDPSGVVRIQNNNTVTSMRRV